MVGYRGHSNIYDPNSLKIIPKYNVGDILYNSELNFVAYLIERRFIGIKNYSYREANEMLNDMNAELETWYYLFKVISDTHRYKAFDRWQKEWEVGRIIDTGAWKYHLVHS